MRCQVQIGISVQFVSLFASLLVEWSAFSCTQQCFTFFTGIHLGPEPAEIQANLLPQVIRGNGPSIYSVSGCLIKTGGFLKIFPRVLLEKCLKTGRSGSAKELLKNYKNTKFYLTSSVVLLVSTPAFVGLNHV